MYNGGMGKGGKKVKYTKKKKGNKKPNKKMGGC